MVNRNKMRGDKYERDILAICHEFGFTEARRTRPGRMEDQGDIHLTHDGRHILQTKDAATPDWREWLTGLARQKYAAQAATAALVVKRRGSGANPPIHLAVMNLDDYLALIERLTPHEITKEVGGARDVDADLAVRAKGWMKGNDGGQFGVWWPGDGSSPILAIMWDGGGTGEIGHFYDEKDSDAAELICDLANWAMEQLVPTTRTYYGEREYQEDDE